MPFYAHERFQVFCRFCQDKIEADSTEDAARRIEEHEQACPKRQTLK